jgi:hemoglobin-like flavoprotein
MTPDQKRLVRETWKQVAPTGEAVADLLYRRLFEIDPTARELFRAKTCSRNAKSCSRH